MVEKIKASKIKVSNMHFVVGDVVQRNIKLFRNQESTPLYKDIKHRTIIEAISKEMAVPLEST